MPVNTAEKCHKYTCLILHVSIYEWKGYIDGSLHTIWVKLVQSIKSDALGSDRWYIRTQNMVNLDQRLVH